MVAGFTNTTKVKLQTKIELLKNRISQKQIAERAGVSNTSVHAYLTGRMPVSTKMEERIGTAIAELLNNDKTTNN